MNLLNNKNCFIAFVFILVSISISIIGCKKGDNLNIEPVAETTWKAQYSKEITLSDKSGKNTMTIEISTNEEDDLDYFNAKSFEVIPFYEPPMQDKNDDNPTDLKEDISELEEKRKENDVEYYIHVLEKSFEEGVLGSELRVSPNTSNNLKSSCPYFGIYFTNGTNAIGIRNCKSSCGSGDYVQAIFYSFNQGNPIMFAQGYYYYWKVFSYISCSGSEYYCCSHTSGSAKMKQYLKSGKRTGIVFQNNNNWTVGMSVAHYNSCVGNPFGVFVFS